MRLLTVAVLTAPPLVVSFGAAPTGLAAQTDDPFTAPYPDEICSSCAEWNEPLEPFRIHGDTYWVGTSGLGAVLITSSGGHVLIDGGLPDSAPLILDNISTLGFEATDVELIVNSHAHFDHAGGVAAIQRATGARVAASGPAAPVLESGSAAPNDPQFGVAFDFPPVPVVDRFDDGETLRVGDLRVTAHLTPGHSPGGTSWSWTSCEDGECLGIVYADSQTPVSSDDFQFTDTVAHPTALTDFEHGFAVLETLPCDILITPHPGASQMFERMASGPEGLVDPTACRRYVQTAREQLERRLESERSTQP